MIRGLIIRPSSQPEVIEFKEGYKELQRLVDGPFEMPYLFDDVDVIVNEEGKLNGLLPNRFLYYNDSLVDVLVGNIVLVNSNDEGETISLTDELIEKYMEIFSHDRIYLS